MVRYGGYSLSTTESATCTNSIWGGLVNKVRDGDVLNATFLNHLCSDVEPIPPCSHTCALFLQSIFPSVGYQL